MDGKELLDILKQQFDVKSDIDLSKAIGISIATINKWKSNSAKLTPRQVGNLVSKARKKESESCIASAIQPIIEYYQINHTDSRQGANWELIPSKTGRGKIIRSELETANGIYIYYNSRNISLVTGKTAAEKVKSLIFQRYYFF